MATTLPNTGAIIPAMTDQADQAVNNAAFTAIDTAVGAIIESGSNANGSYVKFADGTLICSRGIVNTFALGSYTATDCVFPSLFYDTYFRVLITNYISGYRLLSGATQKSASSVTISTYNFDAPVTAELDVVAIGRWRA